MTQAQATYSPAVFDVGTIDQAKRIILTPEGDSTTNQRWKDETSYLLSVIEKSIPLTEKSIVLDYGCGIGRMAKALIDEYKCRVVGVDISPSMRALAAAYVSSDRFFSCDPAAMYWLGTRFDAALAIWVLQHCFQVEEDIARIKQSLIWKGKLLVLNDHRRLVPTKEVPWINDGRDVRKLLQQSFSETSSVELEADAVGEAVAHASYLALFQAEG